MNFIEINNLWKNIFEIHNVLEEKSLVINVIMVVIFSFLCWILSIFTKNYSWTDRIWSFSPFICTWIFFYFSPSIRTIICTILPTLWGIRLTFNFYRKGGYNIKNEDYRWSEVKVIKLFLLYKKLN